MNWKSRLIEAFGTNQPDDDVLEELSQHAAATYASARAEGVDATDAERRVDLQIQAWTRDPALLKRRPRRAPAIVPPAGSGGVLASIVQDARYALRLMRREPPYAALVIATMALGIAATTVLGSVAYGVLLKPLPWAGAPRLVRIYEARQGSTQRFRPMMTNMTYRAWSGQSSTLEAIGAWASRETIVTDAAAPYRMPVASVTPELFALLEAAPVLGRLFAPGEGEPGKPHLLILSYGLWQERFGGRADAIGQVLHFDAQPYTIVGVMPARFAFPDRETRAWMPFYVPPPVTPGKSGTNLSMFQAVARLRPGITPAQAAAEGTSLARSAPITESGRVTAMAVFGSSGSVEITVVPLLDSLVADVKPAILILLAAVALLLVTATANVASLQLARATTRRRELAIRNALGAARGRLVRQTLVENLLLGLLACAVGLTLAGGMVTVLPSILPADFPRVHDIALDWRIVAFALGVSIASGIGCGILPALQSARNDMVSAIAEDSLAPVGGALRSRTSRVRAGIMAAQIAIACVLLVGASLLARSFVSLLHANIGYDPLNVLTAEVVFPRDAPPNTALAALDRLTERLTASGDARTAAYATMMPFGAREALSSFPLKRRDGTSIQVQTGFRLVSAGYFEALGQRLIEGREFTQQDTAASRRVAIVNREFSQKYLGGRALGWALPANVPDNPTLIIGVVENTARRSVTDTPQPEAYYASSQRPFPATDVHLVIRTKGDPRGAIAPLRALARAEAPGAALEKISTMEDLIGASLSQPRLYAILLGTFAAFALAIAGVGLFGVLSYTVAQRAREIGVRSALGAQISDIVRLVVAQSMTIAGAGLAAGLIGSYWAAEAVKKFLYGVKPHDAVTFVAVAVLLLVVAGIASVVPARRAAAVDPVKVLRS